MYQGQYVVLDDEISWSNWLDFETLFCMIINILKHNFFFWFHNNEFMFIEKIKLFVEVYQQVC